MHTGDNTGEPGGISIHTGFPNPATDKSLRALDFNQLLIHNPASTFLFRIEGQGWEDLGIFDGDIAVVDRALTARQKDVVIWWSETQGEFRISWRKDAAAGGEMWGVITSVVHQMRKKAGK